MNDLHRHATVSAYNETKGFTSIADHHNGGAVVCPKPRRIGVVLGNNNPTSHVAEVSNSKASAELLDIILKKKDLGTELLPPSFFCGSPPSRVPNPLVQDVRFGEEDLLTLKIRSRLSSLARKGGCVTPAAVKIEGFDCLNRDGQNSRIHAIA